MKRNLVVVALGLSLAPLAQSAPARHVLPEGLADADCVALVPIKGLSRAMLPTGPTADVSLVIADGRIQALGADLDLSVDAGRTSWKGRSCVVVDISGRTITPGLVEVSSQLGLVEVSLESGTRDGEHSGSGYSAGLAVADAYNPDSTLIPIARIEGVTSAVVQPGGGRLAGTAALVDLAGATQAESLVDPAVAIVGSMRGDSRAAGLAELRNALADARSWARNKAGFERGASRDLVAGPSDLEALQAVLSRELPLIVAADRAADVEALIRFADEERIRVVIRGGAEAWRHAEALAEAEIPVIVDPMVYGAGGFDQVHGRKDNAALLHAAGVPVVLSTFSSHNARLLRQSAGNAVRGGLDHDVALAAISSVPARLFGGPDRGELAVGQVANVVAFDGDPLELATSVTQVFIEGRAIPLDSRQWRLFMHYEQLPGTPVPALSLPTATD